MNRLGVLLRICILWSLVSCAHYQEIDRSSLNHPLMQWDSNMAPKPSSPLTGLSESGNNGGGPCSVCAK